MREIRKNSMRKHKKSGNSKFKKSTHYYNKGDNMEYRPLHPVMNRVNDVHPLNNTLAFSNFVNVITILFAFWGVVGFLIWYGL